MRTCDILQIESDAGLPEFATSEEAVEQAAKLMTLFKACQHLYEKTDEKDRGPADDLPVLAVSALVAAWKLDSTKQPKHLLQVAQFSNNIANALPEKVSSKELVRSFRMLA